ncbi:MAG: hypothetical protein WBO31_09135 [Saprospiraceae bacterium]|nr:hypothetical protein [Saprospiraceae bacterium]
MILLNLTNDLGERIWINPTQIAYITSHMDKTRIYFIVTSGSGLFDIDVKETPEQVAELFAGSTRNI